MEAVIRWEEPPPGRGNPRGSRPPGSKYDRLAVELAANPDRWALIQQGPSRTNADNLAHRIRGGLISCFAPPGYFDACVRTVGDVHCVYARYCGDGEAADV